MGGGGSQRKVRTPKPSIRARFRGWGHGGGGQTTVRTPKPSAKARFRLGGWWQPEIGRNPENEHSRSFSGLGAWQWWPDDSQNPENEREGSFSGLGGGGSHCQPEIGRKQDGGGQTTSRTPKTSTDACCWGSGHGGGGQTTLRAPKTSMNARFRGWWWWRRQQDDAQNPENEHECSFSGLGAWW